MKYYLTSLVLAFVVLFPSCKDKESEPCATAPSGTFDFFVNSGEENGDLIGDVSSEGSDFTYHIVSGNDDGLFGIDNASGEVSLVKADSFFSSTLEEYLLAIESRYDDCPAGNITANITKDDFGLRVEQIVKSVRDKYGIQGIGYTLLLPEKSVKMGLIGHRKVGVELDKEKLWHVTSNTKMVTATMILQLMEEGKLSLEDPISKFGISYDKIDESYKIKHLLGHNTNYGNYTESGTAIWPEIYGNPSKVYDLDFLLKNYLPNSNSNPTTGYMYNNTNYAILGMIVEGLTGKDLATAAKERIFDPLGLTKTSLRTEGMDVKELNGVYRYFGNDLQDLNSTPVMSYLSMWGGAGAMVTTTDEFAVLVKNLLSSKFLKQETIDLATTSSPGSTKTFGDYTISYGLGFSLTEYKGFSSYGHGGNGLHKSVSLHDSENNITITFAYNHMADHDDTKRAELGTALYELALKEIGKL